MPAGYCLDSCGSKETDVDSNSANSYETLKEVCGFESVLLNQGKAVRMKKIISFKLRLILLLAIALVESGLSLQAVARQQMEVQMPSSPLKFGVFSARFNADNTFSLEGYGWPSMKGSWKLKGDEIELMMSDVPNNCT
jgi:hypothetical protein